MSYPYESIYEASIYCRLLPAKEGPETGPKVLIQHNQELLVQSTASAPKEVSNSYENWSFIT